MRQSPSRLSFRRAALAAGLVTALAAAAPAAAQDRLGWDQPSYGEMAVDGFVVRPVGFISTVLGTGAWIVTLPFSALGGNAGEAAQELIVRPARFTFVRPLGDF
jgi:hypothetical protein